MFNDFLECFDTFCVVDLDCLLVLSEFWLTLLESVSDCVNILFWEIFKGFLLVEGWLWTERFSEGVQFFFLFDLKFWVFFSNDFKLSVLMLIVYDFLSKNRRVLWHINKFLLWRIDRSSIRFNTYGSICTLCLACFIHKTLEIGCRIKPLKLSFRSLFELILLNILLEVIMSHLDVLVNIPFFIIIFRHFIWIVSLY